MFYSGIVPLEDRSRRIVEIAAELAEAGGFEAVRQRDVAARAGVALGTLYKRFPSKEGMLVAALELEHDKIVRKLTAKPAAGKSPEERVDALFRIMTRQLCRKPNLARALIKALTSGEPEVSGRALSYHASLTEIIAAALASSDGSQLPSQLERELATTLQQIWFAGLIGWMGGLHAQHEITERVTRAARWMLAGARAQGG